MAVRSAALDPSRSSEIVGDGVGPDPCADVRERLHQLLLDCPRQIGSVYRAMIERPHAGPAELLPLTECANSGAVGNLRAIVLAVTDGQIPRSPARAAQGARFVRTLVRQVQDEEVRARLRETLEGLEERGALYDRNPARAGGERGAAVADRTVRPTVDCGGSGGELPFPGSTGLIVYTYPDYRRVPCDADRNRWLLNVGSTDDERETREIVEASESDMPEAPVILRFYGLHTARQDGEPFSRDPPRRRGRRLSGLRRQLVRGRH